MYLFKGTAVDCGNDSSGQTPVLFPNKDIIALALEINFSTLTGRWQNVHDLSFSGVRLPSNHITFDLVYLMQFAWKRYYQAYTGQSAHPAYFQNGTIEALP